MANFTGSELEDLPDDSFFLPYVSAIVIFSMLCCMFCCCFAPVPIGLGVFFFDKAEKTAAPSTASSAAFGGTTSGGNSFSSSSHMIYNGLGYGFISVCGGCFPLCCCFGVGCLFIAIYAGMFSVIENQDYYGPMLVTGYDFVESSAKVGESNRYDYSLAATARVTYGYDWACPDQGGKVCTNVAVDMEDCGQYVCTGSKTGGCSEQEYGQAKEKATICLAEQVFFLDNITSSDQLDAVINNFSYNASIYPLDADTTASTQPPISYLYGDCDQCTARTEIPDAQTAIDLKDSGGSMMLFGLILLCCGACCSAAFKPKHPPPTSNNAGSTSPAVPSNTDTAHYASPYGGETSTPAYNTSTNPSYTSSNYDNTKSSGPTGGFADALGPSPGGPISYK